MERKIALIGAGLVGRGWAIVFARAGFQVALFDGNQRILDQASGLIGHSLEELAVYGLVDDPEAILGRIQPEQALAQALAGVEYVQESVFEQVDAKKRVFAAIDEAIGPRTLIGSSSSGIPASAFTEDLRCRERCLIVHPVNPPYLAPVVELVPAPWTAPRTVESVRALMEQTGQVPVVVNREIEGFLINRLQGVLLMEAWRLVEEGYAAVEDLDRTVKHGLGLRWSFMGPFETIDLNAPGGIADYARRLGPLYQRIAASRAEHRVWSPELILEVERQRRAILPQDALSEQMAWRDQRLMALLVHQRAQGGWGSES